MKRLAKNLIVRSRGIQLCRRLSQLCRGIEENRLRLFFHRLHGDRSLDGEG